MRASFKTLCIAIAAPAILASVLFLQSACPKAPPPPPPPAKVVARVDGAPIYLAALEREMARVRRSARADAEGEATSTTATPEENAKAVLPPLIDRQILANRARALGLSVSEADVQRATDALADDSAKAGQSFNERLAEDEESAAALHEETRERLLAESVIEHELQVARPTPAELKVYVEAHKSELNQPEEVRAAQILVATPEDAQSILEQLRAGARFDVLAREHSLSPDARAGGDLGFFPKGVMPPPFDEICFSLKPGQLSGIVRSSYGFHIFKLLEKKPARHRTLEEVSPALTLRLYLERRAAAEAQLLDSLRQKASVQIDEQVLATAK